MPELPEVETTCRGISPHVKNQTIKRIKIRNRNLRWPVPRGLSSKLAGHKIKTVKRRAKYLLLGTDLGTIIIHLGMSGSLRVVPEGSRADKHDHVDILLGNKKILRLRDPRRFGCVLFTEQPPAEHKLLIKLGPEPLSNEFDGDYLYKLSRKRKVAVKIFIMNSQAVVGVGNIYASEALFLAGILPRKLAGKLTRVECNKLASAIKRVLKSAIKAGGTSLRDFTRSDGNPGYFAQSLKVYDRKGEPCRKCGNPVKSKVIGQRSTYYCTHCQH